MDRAHEFLFAALDRVGQAEDYLQRELRHDRENNPACLTNEELDRRIAEREAACGGEPF